MESSKLTECYSVSKEVQIILPKLKYFEEKKL